MKYMTKIQITIFSVLMSLSFSTRADNTTPICPTVDLVTGAWAEVNDAIPNDREYIVISKPIINFKDRLWSVRTVVPARNQEDAIKLAQLTVKETKSLMTPTAIKIFDHYGCIYFSMRAYVYALTDYNLK